MKNLSLLCAGVMYTCVLSAQPSFQTSLQAGISLPLNSNDINATHAGKAIHFGNHLDYTFGAPGVRFGLGAYIGYINAIAADNKYREVGGAIAEKYRFNTAMLTFNSSPFKSTHILLGPVASFGSTRFNINVWAKGGYGLNEPCTYTVLYKENGVANNIYINQGGDNKNGLAYSAGAGVKLAISESVGLQLTAGYFATQTDQVNYNFDREKGTTPLYYTASNQFIQAAAGLQFTIGNPGKKSNTVGTRSRYSDGDTNPPINARPDQKIKTKSNIKNDRIINTGNATGDDDSPIASKMDQKIKTKSNIKNDRMANIAIKDADDNESNDSLLFTPSKIELRAKIADAGTSSVPLQSVDNYLTGFVYQGRNGAIISQCGASAMPGEPIPGIDVKLKSANAASSLIARTNKDGSFAFNNIAPGDYTAEAGADKMNVIVNGNADNVCTTLDVMGGSCGSTKENYIINAGDHTYVEVIAPREAGTGLASGRKQIANIKYQDISVVLPRDAASGLATGRRMHKPYRVADTDFSINQDKIFSSDGKLYAEVTATRDAGSGMGTGSRSTIVTGDVDGDGFDDNSIITQRDAASGMATGRRMHKPYLMTKEPAITSHEIKSPRDAASGLATGKSMHQPSIVTTQEAGIDDSISDPDATTGRATGKRMHKPYVVSINADEDTYEVISPRDAASGLPTGKRMHKPLVITKELEITDDGDELVTYKIIHRDLAARNILLTDADEENTAHQGESSLAAGNGLNKKGYDYYKSYAQKGISVNGGKKGYDDYNAKGNENINSNPLFAQSGAAGVNPLSAKTNGNNSNAVQSNPLYEAPATKGVNLMYEQNNSMAGNPLYQSTGMQGENQLYKASDGLVVTGSNGKDHHLYFPENLLLGTKNTNVDGTETYEVGPIRWMSPESINSRKGITEKGIKKNEAAARKGWDGSVKGSGKGINQAGVQVTEDAARKGWDGTVKGGSIAENDAVARKGWDGTVKGGAIVKRIDRIRCADGTCAIEAIVEAAGATYEAVITGVLKTRHDTAKDSVDNLR